MPRTAEPTSELAEVEGRLWDALTAGRDFSNPPSPITASFSAGVHSATRATQANITTSRAPPQINILPPPSVAASSSAGMPSERRSRIPASSAPAYGIPPINVLPPATTSSSPSATAPTDNNKAAPADAPPPSITIMTPQQLLHHTAAKHSFLFRRLRDLQLPPHNLDNKTAERHALFAAAQFGARRKGNPTREQWNETLREYEQIRGLMRMYEATGVGDAERKSVCEIACWRYARAEDERAGMRGSAEEWMRPIREWRERVLAESPGGGGNGAGVGGPVRAPEHHQNGGVMASSSAREQRNDSITSNRPASTTAASAAAPSQHPPIDILPQA
ncbi:hypothetical protein LTR85_003658 [Meristemomyces frigidus]|nr:hypothetical protein LTR85_003658 [Meristemomyces frigidus]